MTDVLEPSDQERAELPTISQQYIEAVEAERDALRIQRDDYRDRLKGISHKINQMLKPVGGETEND